MVSGLRAWPRNIASLAGLLAVVAACSSQAGAQLSLQDAKCRNRIGKGVRRLSDTVVKGSVACHHERMAGGVPPATDCNDPAQLAGAKVTRARAVLSKLTLRGCGGPPADNGYLVCPAPCGSIGIITYLEVATCLACVAENSTGQALGEVYGTPPTAGSSSVATRCQDAIGRALRTYFIKRIKEQQTCQLQEDRAPIGTDCRSADLGGKVARALARARDLIASCEANTPADLDSCGADVPAVQACLEAEATTDADVLFDAVYNPAPPTATPTSTPTVTPLPASPTPTATATVTPPATAGHERGRPPAPAAQRARCGRRDTQ